MASSIRSASFHLAMRSDRENDPTLSCAAFQPTARCTIVTSSVSPERAETMAPRPHERAASSAARVSVIVPAWLGLINTAVHSRGKRRPRARAAHSSPKGRRRQFAVLFPNAAVKRRKPSRSSSARGSSMETIG